MKLTLFLGLFELLFILANLGKQSFLLAFQGRALLEREQRCLAKFPHQQGILVFQTRYLGIQIVDRLLVKGELISIFTRIGTDFFDIGFEAVELTALVPVTKL